MLYLRQNTRNIFKLPNVKKEDFFLNIWITIIHSLILLPTPVEAATKLWIITLEEGKIIYSIKYVSCLLIFSDKKFSHKIIEFDQSWRDNDFFSQALCVLGEKSAYFWMCILFNKVLMYISFSTYTILLAMHTYIYCPAQHRVQQHHLLI